MNLQSPPARDAASQEQRRRLHHDKAEATARYNEGQRLARHRDALLRPFTPKQLEVLEQWGSGKLLAKRTSSIVALGHGRLRAARGDYLQVGGSTGGGSRRISDSWQPPDWRQYLQDK